MNIAKYFLLGSGYVADAAGAAVTGVISTVGGAASLESSGAESSGAEPSNDDSQFSLSESDIFPPCDGRGNKRQVCSNRNIIALLTRSRCLSSNHSNKNNIKIKIQFSLVL